MITTSLAAKSGERVKQPADWKDEFLVAAKLAAAFIVFADKNVENCCDASEEFIVNLEKQLEILAEEEGGYIEPGRKSKGE